MGLIASLSLAIFASAETASPVNVNVKAGIVINGMPSGSSVGGWKSKITPAQNAVPHKITTLGTGLQIEFQSASGTPVDVTNVKFGKFDFTLIQNGKTVWNKVPLGSYHPAGQGSPDYYCYRKDGTDVTPTSGFIAGYLGDNSGANIPVMSKFQLLDQTITLGVAGRPMMNLSGDYYSLVYDIELSYTYEGVMYTKTITQTETEVLVRMVEGLMEYIAPTSNEVPCLVELQVSDDLANWATVPGVVIPSPRPTPAQFLNTINLVPPSGKREQFFRYAMVPQLP